ncbi:uncharacterized protein LOC110448649 [Mizuhopecten yessoensis]|uniref:uncharacterized protein LOC110448649 n=1 Tax=Mizuhopecten yessoensis TaxID=6573 RepID=UPI000B458F4D|nr:uncharacterized protein LOC110448649 [Mizuhopecten yessoensis]
MADSEEKLSQAEAILPQEEADSVEHVSKLFSQMGARPKGDSLVKLRSQMMDFLNSTGGLDTANPSMAGQGVSGNVVSQGIGSTTGTLDTRFYKLPLFSGDQGKGEATFDLWKYEVQCLIDTGKSQDVIGQSIRRSLKGTAARVAMRLGANATPAQLIAKLRSLYGIVDDQETLLENFYAAHQQPKENVTEWACRLEDLLLRADSGIGPAERNKRLHNKFWSGLRQDLRDVTGHKHDSIADYEELCIAVRSIERTRDNEKPSKATVTVNSAVEGEEKEDLRSVVNQLSAAIQRLEKQISDGGTTSWKNNRDHRNRNRGNSNNYGGGSVYHSKPSQEKTDQDEASWDRKPDIICWRPEQTAFIGFAPIDLNRLH